MKKKYRNSSSRKLNSEEKAKTQNKNELKTEEWPPIGQMCDVGDNISRKYLV